MKTTNSKVHRPQLRANVPSPVSAIGNLRRGGMRLFGRAAKSPLVLGLGGLAIGAAAGMLAVILIPKLLDSEFVASLGEQFDGAKNSVGESMRRAAEKASEMVQGHVESESLHASR